MEVTIIQNKIYEVRGYKVIFDYDLAELYEVETKALNQSVKRNASRFPDDFIFRLTQKEWNSMRSQIVTALPESEMRSQFVTASQKKRNISAIPYAFTEHGVTMLASVLKSEKAARMSIAVVRAFITLKQFAIHYEGLSEQLRSIRDHIGNHDAQLSQLYDAIENLLDDRAEQKTWQNRERIGFKK